MKKQRLFVLYFLNILGIATAQQEPIFTLYRESQSIMNPASVSSDFYMNGFTRFVGTSVRTQWNGLKRHPQTAVLSGDYINKNTSTKAPFFRLVTGGFLLNDQVSVLNQTGIYGRIAALGSKDSRRRGVSVGLSAGASWTRLDAANVQFRDVGDLLNGSTKAVIPNFGLGTFYYTSLTEAQGKEPDNFIYGGISIPQILRGSFSAPTTTVGNSLNLTHKQHLYVVFGYIKAIGDRSFVESSVWLKSVPNVPLHTDFNVRVQIAALSLGAGYSTSKTLHAETAFTLNQRFRIGYEFDLNQGIVSAFGTSHELNIRFFY